MSKKAIKLLEELPAEKRQELSAFLTIEKQLLQESGWNTWKLYFITGYLSYAFIFFLIKTKTLLFTPKSIIQLFLPTLPFGLLLKKQYFKVEKYKEYHKMHLKINAFVRKEITKKSK